MTTLAGLSSLAFFGAPSMLDSLEMEVRGGSGNLDKGAEWSFCLTAARMAAEQERR